MLPLLALSSFRVLKWLLKMEFIRNASEVKTMLGVANEYTPINYAHPNRVIDYHINCTIDVRIWFWIHKNFKKYIFKFVYFLRLILWNKNV